VKKGIGNLGVSMALCRGESGEYRHEGDLAGQYLYALNDFTEFAGENGFGTVELTAIPFIHAGVLSGITSDIKRTIAGFDAVTYHLPLGEINIAALHSRIRQEAIEETKRHIDICREVGIGAAIMHPGCFAAMPDIYMLVEAQTRAIAEGSVFEIADYCEGRGIRLSIENLHRREPLFQKPEEFESFVAKGLGVVLDTVHAFESNVNPIDFIEMFGNRITEVHWTDGIKRDPISHYPLGEGEVDCPAVLDALQRIDFEGLVVLEVESKKDLIKSLDFLREKGYL